MIEELLKEKISDLESFIERVNNRSAKDGLTFEFKGKTFEFNDYDWNYCNTEIRYKERLQTLKELLKEISQ